MRSRLFSMMSCFVLSWVGSALCGWAADPQVTNVRAQQLPDKAVEVKSHLSDGVIWAWGDNDYGGLGDGTHTGSTTAVEVAGP